MSGNTLLPFDCICVSYMLSFYLVSKLIMASCCIGNTGASMLAKYYINQNNTLQELNLSKSFLTLTGLGHIINTVVKSKLMFNLLADTKTLLMLSLF